MRGGVKGCNEGICGAESTMCTVVRPPDMRDQDERVCERRGVTRGCDERGSVMRVYVRRSVREGVCERGSVMRGCM